MAKYQLSDEELLDHLKTQVDFLISSSKAFDEGNSTEALRLAVSIRILVHDTAKSTSLLTSLAVKNDISFYDSSFDLMPDNYAPQSGLTLTKMSMGTPEGSVTEYVPRLDMGPPSASPDETKPFDAWWDKPVIRDSQGVEFTRRDLVLNLANKEGGAHVDPVLGQEYAQLTRFNSMGWETVVKTKDGEEVEIEEDAPVLPSVRQIAHELLKSIADKYPDIVTEIPTRHLPIKAQDKVAGDKVEIAEGPTTMSRSFSLPLNRVSSDVSPSGAELFGKPTSQTFRVFFDEFAPKIGSPFRLEIRDSGGLSGYRRDQEGVVLIVDPRVEPEHQESEAAYAMLLAVQSSESWPMTRRPAIYTDDSPEAQIGSLLGSVVRGGNVRDRLTGWGFKLGKAAEIKNRNVTRLLENSDEPTEGSPIWCLLSLGYVELAMTLDTEAWEQVKPLFAKRAPGCAKKGEEILEILESEGWSDGAQGLKSLIGIRESLGLAQAGWCHIYDPHTDQLL